MLLDNLNILIINSNFASRSRLRDVLKSFLLKVNISYAQSLREAKESLMEKDIDIGFVEYDIGIKDITDFISNMKKESSKNMPPFVATLRQRDDGSMAGITNLYLEGVNGFISEPYSSDDIINLLTTLKLAKAKHDQKDKLKKASGLLLNELSRKIDNMAEFKAKEDEGSVRLELKSSKAIAMSLETVYNQDPEQYANALIEAFENIQPPAQSVEKSNKQKKSAAKEIKHPGIVIGELMKHRGLTFESFKHALKIEEAQFNAILNGNAALDETNSREISRIFGKTSREWMKMQKDFDAHAEESRKKKED